MVARHVAAGSGRAGCGHVGAPGVRHDSFNKRFGARSATGLGHAVGPPWQTALREALRVDIPVVAAKGQPWPLALSEVRPARKKYARAWRERQQEYL